MRLPERKMLTAEYHRVNDRRGELIRKKNRQAKGLSDLEYAEYKYCEAFVNYYLLKVFGPRKWSTP